MILNNEKTKCETNMSGGTAFTILANAKVFRILSSGLYSNKEKAIIREVSCNAYDANVDAGNGNIPIEVHLPNALEPYLSIKDSGTGLTPEQMTNIYTQYGNSTKTNDNRMIGALGLGSKSPFAYIDSFTVISITNGIKNTYSCYIDGNGEPKLQPFGTGQETDEANGIEVTFPVKKEDFDKFREEAEKVYRPFLVKPKVTGNSSYKVKDFEVLLTSDETQEPDWQIVKPINTTYYNRENIQVAVQGNIEYPINRDKIEEYLSDNAKQLLRESYRLHFNIGELDIAASREELGYDKKTIANIVKKFEKMASEITDVQNKKIDTFDTKYEARQYISEIKNSSSLYTNFKFAYRGEPISNEISINTDTYEIVKYYKNSRGNIAREALGERWSSTINFRIPSKSSEIIWVYNDNGKKAQAVSKARSLVTYNNLVYLVQDINIFDELGNPDFLNASEIELDFTTKAKRSGKFFKKFTPYTSIRDQWGQNYSTADNLDLDLTKSFYYMEIKGSKPIKNINIKPYIKVAKMLNIIEEDTEVYGVSSTHAKTKKFKEYKSIEFLEFVKSAIKNSKKFNEKVNLLPNYNIKSKITNMDSSIFDLIKDEKFCSELPVDNIFNIVRNDYMAIKGSGYSEESEIVKDMAKKLGITIPNSDYTKHLEIEKTYPLIGSLNWRYNKTHFLEYVKGIDLLKKSREEQEKLKLIQLAANETIDLKKIKNTEKEGKI